MSIDVAERMRDGRVSLGARIRDVRDASGATLLATSAAAGMSLSYLSDVERGRRLPTLEVLDALATALETTVSDLLRGLYPWDIGERPTSLTPPRDGRRRS